MKLHQLLNGALNASAPQDRSDYRNAKMLERNLPGVSVEVEKAGEAYWIGGDEEVLAPIEGDRFCSSWAEVVEKLNTLMEAK